MSEPLHLVVVEEVDISPTTPVWTDFPEVSVNAGASIEFPYKDYVSNADEYYIEGASVFAKDDGILAYTANADAGGTTDTRTFRAVNAASRVYQDQTLTIKIV